MMMETIFIGCDVSSQELYFAYQNKSTWQEKSILNEWEKIEAYVQTLLSEQNKGHQEFHLIVEATGTYSRKLVYALCEKEINVSVISPQQSSFFFKMKNKSTKNDRADARLLAQYGVLNASDLKLYVLGDEKNLQIRQYMDAIEQLEKLKRQVINQLHAHKQLPPKQQNELIMKNYEQNIEQFGSQIESLELALAKINPLESGTDESKTFIKSVVGIGEKIANLFISQTGGLDKFGSAKQLAKFIGIAPTQHQSGSSVRGKASINRKGNSLLRKSIYVATWSAIRFNKAAKLLYQRLKARGKASKVALLAVANLLVRQIFAVVKSKTLFDNDYFEKKQP
jgi:transposase